MGLKLNLGPTFSFLFFLALYFPSRCYSILCLVTMFSLHYVFLHIDALLFALLLWSPHVLLYFVLLLSSLHCCSLLRITTIFMLLLSSHYCSPLHLAFRLVIYKIFLKHKLFILLSKMLGYPTNINGDGYPVILKSGNRFLLFL
jgi:hypothetical protein